MPESSSIACRAGRGRSLGLAAGHGRPRRSRRGQTPVQRQPDELEPPPQVLRGVRGGRRVAGVRGGLGEVEQHRTPRRAGLHVEQLRRGRPQKRHALGGASGVPGQDASAQCIRGR